MRGVPGERAQTLFLRCREIRLDDEVASRDLKRNDDHGSRTDLRELHLLSHNHHGRCHIKFQAGVAELRFRPAADHVGHFSDSVDHVVGDAEVLGRPLGEVRFIPSLAWGAHRDRLHRSVP